jgi:hypothetical protein
LVGVGWGLFSGLPGWASVRVWWVCVVSLSLGVRVFWCVRVPGAGWCLGLGAPFPGLCGAGWRRGRVLCTGPGGRVLCRVQARDPPLLASSGALLLCRAVLGVLGGCVLVAGPPRAGGRSSGLMDPTWLPGGLNSLVYTGWAVVPRGTVAGLLKARIYFAVLHPDRAEALQRTSEGAERKRQSREGGALE